MEQGKVLIVFYSLSGNTKLMAEEIAKCTGGDLLQLEPKNSKIKPKGFMKFVWGGRQVKMGSKPDLMPYEIDFDKYDTVIFGTPIWASRYVPVLHTFLSEQVIKDKKIAFFCCHAGGGNGKSFDGMKELLQGNQFIGDIELKDPQKKGLEVAYESVRTWIQDILA